MKLNESQANTILFALRVAAERYEEHKDTLVKMAEEPNVTRPTVQMYARLVEQFSKQASESRQMACLLDTCESVEVKLRELCQCGHEKSDHAGLNGHGPCIAGSTTDCACVQFTWKGFVTA